MVLSSASSNTINLLKCILCIGVVFIHGFLRPGESALLLGQKWGGQVCEYQNFAVFENVFIRSFLDQICVPLFFIISGFLFFVKSPDRFDIIWFLKKWKSRVKSLLVPYIIANGVIIVFFLLFDIYRGIPIDAVKILHGFWIQPANPPLWFLRDLILSILFAPVFYILIRKTSLLLPIILCIMWLGLIPAISSPIWSTQAFFFFSLGAWFALYEIDWVAMVKKKWWVFLYFAVYLFFLSGYLFFNNPLLLKMSILSGFPLLVSFAHTIAGQMSKPVDSKYVVATFFVFLYHYYLVAFLWRPYCLVLGTSEIALFFAYFFDVFTTIALLYVTFVIIKKLFSRFISVLVGGRV